MPSRPQPDRLHLRCQANQLIESHTQASVATDRLDKNTVLPQARELPLAVQVLQVEPELVPDPRNRRVLTFRHPA